MAISAQHGGKYVHPYESGLSWSGSRPVTPLYGTLEPGSQMKACLGKFPSLLVTI